MDRIIRRQSIMKKLIERLQRFNYHQLDAFVRHIKKHEHDGTDCTNDNNRWGWKQRLIENHLIEELCEYFNLSKEEYNTIIKMTISRPERNIDETIDIANLS